MRRLSPSPRSIQALSGPAQLCAACRSRLTKAARAAPFSSSSAQWEDIPFSERIRRKLWGTDQPPGRIDPYDPNSPLREIVEDPKQGKEAEEQVTSTENPEYKPATTWDGLESVGEDIGDEYSQGHKHFEGFMISTRLEKPEDVTAALHRAVIEVYTLHQLRQPFWKLFKSVGPDDLTRSVQAAPSSDSKGAILVYPGNGVKLQILRSILGNAEKAESSTELEEETTSSAESTTSSVEANDLESTMEDTNLDLPDESVQSDQSSDQAKHEISSWDPSWLSVPLTDARIKFAVMKRVMQLTGKRIPDPVISQIIDVESLRKHLITPPKPKKLAQELLQSEMLITLPNVTIFDRRITPIDKERRVGRWKVIKKELQAKGLPVYGHR